MFVSAAHAQEVVQNATSSISDWVFIAIGIVLAVLAVIMIFKKFDVSSGHAIVLGVAVAVASLPYVANFEWNKDGFKFTTKAQGSQLADQLASLTQQQLDVRENLKNVGEALKAATERMAVIEAAVENTGAQITPPASPRFNLPFFEDLISENTEAIQSGKQQLNEVESLKQQFLVQ
jgi:hypothetical protein